MSLSKSKKRLIIIFSIVVGLFLVALLSINLILGAIIKGKVNATLEKNESEYKVEIGGVGGNIFFGNIRLKNITVKPDSALLQKLKDGLVPSGTVYDIELPLFRIAGLGLYNTIVDGVVDIRRIELKRARVKIYKGPQPDLPEGVEVPEEPITFDPDSIYLEGVNGISIGAVILSKNVIQVINIENDKQIIQNKISHFEFTDFYLVAQPEGKNVFKLVVDEFRIEAKHEEFDLPGGNYIMSFKELVFTMSDHTLVISKFKLKPTFKDKYKMAAQWKYTKEIFDLDINEIKVHSINTYKLVTERAIFIDSVNVTGADVDIFKDKRYPFDESKRPKLPQQLFKTMKMPLYIGLVKINDSKLIYKEKNKTSKDLLTVILGSLSGEISFITSVKDSIRTKKSIKIKLRSKMMNKPLLTADFELPLYNKNNVFYFSGSLGSAPLKTFNPAAFPALGIKFTEGNLKSLTFKASATDSVSNGEMTMLYENLKTQVIKKDQVSKNKFLSWAANSVVKTSNPGKSGKTRVAVMGYDRDMYKGFMNLVWKTLQTGITNSILPGGKQVKKEDGSPSRKELKQAEKEESQAREETSEETKKENRKNKKKKNKKNKIN